MVKRAGNKAPYSVILSILLSGTNILVSTLFSDANIRGCIQKFPD